MTEFHVYDTTLRDGAQQEGLTLSVSDKLEIAKLLDELGVGFIEGGWPGAVPKDTEFFERAKAELPLKHAVLAAFGATRKAGVPVLEDAQVRALADSGAPVVTLVAKSDVRHVEQALKTTREENLAMVRDTVSHLVGLGRRVFLDAEHFFDGYAFDAEYTTQVVAEGFRAGAEVVILCDTNGGMLPFDVYDVVSEIKAALEPEFGERVKLGIHAHNDSGCAVANSMAAVQAGAMQVQGCVNGYGERTGNADLIAVVANLEIKKGMQLLPEGALGEATRIAHAISEITNITPFGRQPYVGVSAFAHKAGLHASAIRVDPDLYQHTDPRRVGNDMRMIISEMAGRASIELKSRELGFELGGQADVLGRITDLVKENEARGYTYDAADASFELLVRDVLGSRESYYSVESWRVISEHGATSDQDESEATVKVSAQGQRAIATGEGNGPVNALDQGLRQALAATYPDVFKFELIDYAVRILDSQHGTDATIRVLIEMQREGQIWRTVGVGTNILEASWEALNEAIEYGLGKFSGSSFAVV
ncbi:citramalate synthase [Micrococcales bacterium 31B]|nr:citramalate synthase [Micrococcales bacterium 31B]